jgi:hypothetical protein
MLYIFRVKEVGNFLSLLTTGVNDTSGKFTAGLVDTREENFTTGAEFLDVIGTEVLRVFLLAILIIHSHLYLWILLPSPFEQKYFETGL